MRFKKKRNSDASIGNISIGGNVSGNNIVTGDNNRIGDYNYKLTEINDTDIENARRNRKMLLDSLSQSLSSSEIVKMSFLLGVDYDLIEHNTKVETMVSLIDVIERRGLFPKLLMILKSTRPDVFDLITQKQG